MPVVPPHRALAFLHAESGPERGRWWGIAGSVTVGRDGEVRLADPAASRHHATLRARASGVSGADAGGTNPVILRRGPRRCPLGGRFRRLAPGSVLQIGSGRYRLVRPVRRSSRLALGVSPVRLALPLAMSAAMLPFALGGPPWRWIMVLVPLLGALAFVTGSGSRTVAVRRGEDPLGIWVASHEGSAFAREPVLPRRPRALRRGALAGTGWAVADEGTAAWLAGFLAVHNDPEVLGVDSPWIRTGGADSRLLVRIAAAPVAAPTATEAVVTWGSAAPGWAVRLRVRRRATAAWAAALAPARGPVAGLPGVVHLADVADLGAAAVRRAWTGQAPRLTVPVGRDERGDVALDLAAEGPHLLVAGTTGAGKSEFLTSLLLALAASNSPDRLSMILVDFKGGAAFGPLTRLPHCVGLLTDLDQGGAERALGSLRAQLTRRERILAEAGLKDIAALEDAGGSSLPRLLVVVDEFRAFADDHPDLLAHFQRLAAQGRSLGVHLVVATQRPAGAVPADLRANLPARLCLRVAEPGDSSELIGDPAAARLPAIPGRAVLATSRRLTLQLAWAGSQEDVEELVERLRTAWDGERPAAPWLPPLPAHVPSARTGPAAVALADLPHELRQEPVALPATLLVAGPLGSGRTGAARAAAAAALALGEECWVVTSTPWAWPAGRARWGGFVDPRQTRLMRRLVQHATEVTARRALVLDDLEDWLAAEDALHGPGSGMAALTGLLRAARPDSLRLVVCAGPDQVTSRWASHFPTRIVLAGSDAGTAALAGVPRALAPALRPPLPGRGILLPAERVVQVVSPGEPSPGRPARTFSPLPAAGPAVRRDEGRAVAGADDEGEVWVADGEDVVVIGRPGPERDRAAASLSGAERTGALHSVSPQQWASAYGGELGRIKETATVVVVRPDLTGPPHGLDIAAELEPGGEGYGVIVRDGRARAIRLAGYSSPGSRRSP